MTRTEFKKGDVVFLKGNEYAIRPLQEVEIVSTSSPDNEGIWVKTNVPFKVKESDLIPDVDGWFDRVHNLGIKIKQ
jgi:lipoate-protein ligase B